MSMQFWRTTIAIIAVLLTAVNLARGPNWIGMISMWVCGSALTMAINSATISKMRDAFDRMHACYNEMQAAYDDAIQRRDYQTRDAPTISPNQDANKRLH